MTSRRSRGDCPKKKGRPIGTVNYLTTLQPSRRAPSNPAQSAHTYTAHVHDGVVPASVVASDGRDDAQPAAGDWRDPRACPRDDDGIKAVLTVGAGEWNGAADEGDEGAQLGEEEVRALQGMSFSP